MVQRNVLAYYFYQKANNLYPVSESAVDDAVQHARDAFPEESVGIVAGGKYFRLTNVHEDPMNFFEVSLREWKTIADANGGLQAVIHSHPKNQQGATKADMEAQKRFGVPFGIVVMHNHSVVDVLFWGGGTPIAPYIGRPFKDGIYDCFALATDWYKQEAGVIIPNYPREPVWWEDTEHPNLIEDNFIKEGFREIEFEQLTRGDAIVGSIYSEDRINHCGIYLGDGLILHHIYGNSDNPRISGTDVIYSWKRFIRKCLRYKDGVQVPARSIYG